MEILSIIGLAVVTIGALLVALTIVSFAILGIMHVICKKDFR